MFMRTAKRAYYAIHSYMGLDYTIESHCYRAYSFDSAAERDTWVTTNEYEDGHYVARAATRAEAYKVAGINSIHKRATLTPERAAMRMQAAWA